ncbi:hypothetical protein CDL15_Pgr025493 [Punica granatum]|uniref:Uncharacterized protein n=1 Tax=Punica granatum TaxID=22663 RepID=A0A218W9G9_PUNGR|nr:hypothetical protein CDL15_Pgr025493 [Punica granatum]
MGAARLCVPETIAFVYLCRLCLSTIILAANIHIQYIFMPRNGYGVSDGVAESVDYQTISPGDLAKAMENLLVSGFKESCGLDMDITKVACLGSCSVQADGSQKISDLQSLHGSSFSLDYLRENRGDYLKVVILSSLWRGRRLEGNADLIMICLGESAGSDEIDTSG